MDSKAPPNSLDGRSEVRPALQEKPSVEDDNAHKALKNIIIIRYLLDYEEYLPDDCIAFKNVAEAKKRRVANTATFINDRTWTVVQEQIEHEEKEWACWEALKRLWYHQFKDRPPPPIPTTSAIRQLCYDMRFDTKNAFYAIRVFTHKEKLKVGRYVENRRWDALACQLKRDYSDLPAVLVKGALNCMTNVLDRVRDRFFVGLFNPEGHALSSEALVLIIEDSLKRPNLNDGEVQELLELKKSIAKNDTADSGDIQELKAEQGGSSDEDDSFEEDEHLSDRQ